MNEQRNYVRFEIAKRRKLMFQIQRKFEKLKILEKKIRIKVFVMIIRKIHNLKKMIVDKQRDESFYLVCYRFFH